MQLTLSTNTQLWHMSEIHCKSTVASDTKTAPVCRARSAAVGDYQKACLQDDQELLRLCREMDEHLRAAREALMLRGPFFPAQLPPLLTSSLYLQQVMGVGMAPLPQPPGLPPPPMFLPPPPSQGGLPGQSFWPVR